MPRRSDGGAAHFGVSVVALEKDEVFKRERACTRSTVRVLFPPDSSPRTLLRDVRRERAEIICKRDNVQFILVGRRIYT